MRLSETEARSVLLIRAVEDTDHAGALLAPRTLAATTRRVFDDGGPADDEARLRRRAALLVPELARAAPGLDALARRRPRRGLLALVLVGGAAAVGAATNLLGPERHVSVLAFPLAGILAWNLVVYVALLARTLLRPLVRLGGTPRVADGLARVNRWLEGGPGLDTGPPSMAAIAAAERFQRMWLATVAPLLAARLRVVLHLAALAMAAGAIAGMYVSGLALEYRATWESTWLDAPAVQRYVDVVLGPAARLLGVPVPDVGPLRGPDHDGPAAPWIHLWATTLGLFVLAPRAILAATSALAAARLARWLPVQLDSEYTRRALHAGRGAATVVDVVYYSCAPDARLRERLHARLQERAGARAVVRDRAHLEYGAPADAVPLPEDGSLAGLLVVVFPLAQTPEAEVHGEFLERLAHRLEHAGWQLAVVLETATYRDRVGPGARVRERRATWERLLREVDLAAEELG